MSHRSVATAHSEYGALGRVLLRHPRDAYADDATLDEQWRSLGYVGRPDLGRAVAEFDGLVDVLREAGADVTYVASTPNSGLDSIYVRDATIVTDQGVVLCRMGKEMRRDEPAAQAATFDALGVPVLGSIQAPGTVEGGDVAWVDGSTLAVGRGYRTNDEGIRQLGELLGAAVELMVVPLPHWRGPGDVFHLMSMFSPVDRDLAVVYSPLLPVPFREDLSRRGIGLVEVPDEEFDTMGTNVLALAPRRCLVLSGNPVTRARLEAAGADVIEYEGEEISRKGCGGPTCLTRPVERGG